MAGFSNIAAILLRARGFSPGTLPRGASALAGKGGSLLRLVLLIFSFEAVVAAESGTSATASRPPAKSLYITEYRVLGVHALSRAEVESAVYPFLGPERTQEDVDQARAALEKAYQAKGYQTVFVQIPQQTVKKGVVMLQVTEGTVGRLRVNGSRYFSPSQIKAQAPSMAPGTVVDFNQVSRDIVALNQLPDRKVTPVMRAGEIPGTVDIDLNVKDTLPLHGSVELNNRYSANTTPLRINGSVSYNNLWQLGHSAGFSFQVAPQNIDDAEVFSGYYIARFSNLNWLSLMALGTYQNSNVSTLGGSAVAGKGQTAGLRAIINLPNGKDFYHSISLGLDYKHYDQDMTVAGSHIATPTTYYPLSASYNANWVGKRRNTQLNTEIDLGLRGLGSNLDELNNSRFKADGNYILIRGDFSHTQDLPGGAQAYAKFQGQVADQPLLSNEQISGGGLSTVRGYLESTVLGDNGIFGTLELRSPSLGGWSHGAVDEWRVYVFGDAGMTSVINPLPQQQERFSLASFGVGTRLRLWNHLNGSLDVGVPLIGQGETSPYDLLFTFRVWAEF